jgi:hypothetical protein
LRRLSTQRNAQAAEEKRKAIEGHKEAHEKKTRGAGAACNLAFSSFLYFYFLYFLCLLYLLHFSATS